MALQGLMSRDFSGDPTHLMLKAAIEVPTRAYLWVPEDEIEFIPALSNNVWGDGRALLGITTINARPRFYVVRIDSGWRVGGDWRAPDDALDLHDVIEDISVGLEEEFGSGRPLAEEWEQREFAPPDITDDEWEYGPAWPAYDDRDGCSWWREEWSELPGVHLIPHPFTSRANLQQVQSSAANVEPTAIADTLAMDTKKGHL